MHSQITLYDDWRDRAARLKSGETAAEPFELRILNFLLRRYENAPEAARPSQGRASAGFFVNDRAIVVNHHLRLKETPDVKSRRDANARVHAIVDRMNVAPPATAIEGPIDKFGAKRARWINQRRAKLADPDRLIRMAAAEEVGRYGDLEDIGMLLDLLALPVVVDEDPRERELLRSAIEQLSRPGNPFASPNGPWRIGLPDARAKRRSLGADIFRFIFICLGSVLLTLCYLALCVIAARRINKLDEVGGIFLAIALVLIPVFVLYTLFGAQSRPARERDDYHRDPRK